MDTLALLCNLHGDGPATLQRLRRAGCESLAALCRIDAGQLAVRLDWNARAAERFLREAALLAERVREDEPARNELERPGFELGTAELGREPVEVPIEVVAEGFDGTEEDDEIEDEIEQEDEDESCELDAGEEEVEPEADEVPAPPAERVEAILGAWRELDRVAPPGEPGEYVLPRPPSQPDRDLAAIQLEGLTPRLVARLAELGVTSLRALVGARELELARGLPLAFTRVRHLQFRAARLLDALPPQAPEAPAPVAAAFEPFTPPPTDPFETAGPFA